MVIGSVGLACNCAFYCVANAGEVFDASSSQSIHSAAELKGASRERTYVQLERLSYPKKINHVTREMVWR